MAAAPRVQVKRMAGTGTVELHTQRVPAVQNPPPLVLSRAEYADLCRVVISEAYLNAAVAAHLPPGSGAGLTLHALLALPPAQPVPAEPAAQQVVADDSMDTETP